jgi:hypothetical protein
MLQLPAVAVDPPAADTPADLPTDIPVDVQAPRPAATATASAKRDSVDPPTEVRFVDRDDSPSAKGGGR